MKLWGITHRGAVRQQNQDAYAVTDHCKAPAILPLPDGKGLLVLLAHRTSVGDSA